MMHTNSTGIPGSAKNESAPHSSGSEFVTDFLPLASYLLASQFVPRLTQTASGTILFTFTATEGLAATIHRFHAGVAQVEPAAYDAARLQLRRRMEALKDRGQ